MLLTGIHNLNKLLKSDNLNPLSTDLFGGIRNKILEIGMALIC